MNFKTSFNLDKGGSSINESLEGVARVEWGTYEATDVQFQETDLVLGGLD